MYFNVLDTIDSSEPIPEQYPSWKDELDNYTAEKKTELDEYTATKESELDTHKTNLETEMTATKDSLVEEIETSQNGFDENVTTKTNAFNKNVTEKTNSFNTNATSKTNDFNTNANTKKTEYDNNATNKLQEYNNNSTDKLEEYNTNATNKVNEFNENVDSLENELTELASQMPWNTTEIAKSIHVEDSAKYSRNKLDLFGDLTQEKREGINLLPSGVETNITENGVTFTCNGKGKYTVNGTATKDTFIYIDLKKNVTLPTNETLYLHIRNNASNTLIFGIPESDNYTPVCSEINRITTSTKLNSGNKITKIYLKVVEGNTSNIELQPSIELSGDDTNFEQYGAMPSLDYPSMPQVVTGVQKIKRIGKNLLKFKNGRYSSNGIIADVIDGKIILNGTSTSISFIQIPFIHKFNNDVVSLSANNDSTVGDEYENYSAIRVMGDIYTMAKFHNKNGTKTFTLNGEIRNITIRTGKGLTYNNFVLYPQLEFGQPTPYEPYKEEIINLGLGDTELCKITDENGNVVAQDNFVKTETSWKIPNKILKIDSYNGEEITRNYVSSTGGLDEGATIYYINNIDLEITDEKLIEQLDKLYKLSLQKGTNNIFVESENGLTTKLQLTYMQDLMSQINELKQAVVALGGNE